MAVDHEVRVFSGTVPSKPKLASFALPEVQDQVHRMPAHSSTVKSSMLESQ